jgi:hypothetical protein
MQAMIDEYRHILDSGGNPEELRRMLNGFIERITVERDGQVVRGTIQVYLPSRGPPAAGSVSMAWGGLGALSQRHTYTVEFTAQVRVYRKRQ